MYRLISRGLIIVIATLLICPVEATSTVLFDFDQIQATSKKGVSGADVELYMEGLYGSGLSVSPKTTAVHGPSFYGSSTLSGLAGHNSYLTVGKGKKAPSIVINFDDNPIDSFSVDFKLFKKAKSLSILADGELINHQTLSKAQRKTGLSGQSTFFFDTPIHSLQFVGSKKKSFAIDNLSIDLPGDFGFASNLNGNLGSFPSGTDPTSANSSLDDISAIVQPLADVSEPSSLLLFTVGSLGFWGWRVRKARLRGMG
jgi:hypothetical protein